MSKTPVPTRAILSLLLAAMVSTGCLAADKRAYPKQSADKRYRGFTVCTLKQKDLEDAAKKWHANQVRYMMCPIWQRRPGLTTQATFDKMVADLPAGLDRAKKLGLSVIIDLHQVPVDNPTKDSKGKPIPYWDDPAALAKYLECWRRLAKISAGREEDIWLELANEPLDYRDMPTFPKNWPIWAQKGIDEVRKIDKTHPIVISSGPGGLVWGFREFPLLDGRGGEIIYSLHQWQPIRYTHQGVHPGRIQRWPGDINDSGGGWWDRKRLEVELAPVIEFQKRHGVRIYCGEFGVARWAPDATRFLRDNLELMEKYGWDWSYHAFREAGVWSLEHGETTTFHKTDPNGTKRVVAMLADPKDKTIKYTKYGARYKGVKYPPKPTGLTNRGKVVLEYMKRNLTPEVPVQVKKVLFLGGRITRQKPHKGFAWTGDWGMSAGAQAKDYAHITFNRICKARRGAKPELRVEAMADESKLTASKEAVAFAADTVVLQVGEAFFGDADAAFGKSYAKLIAQFKSAGAKRIYCIGMWSGGQRDELIRAAAEAVGARFVPIGHLSKLPAYRGVADDRHTHGEVNWLPGDAGMKAIAEELWRAAGPDIAR